MIKNCKAIKNNPHQATIDGILENLNTISAARQEWQSAYDTSNQNLYSLLAHCLEVYYKIKGQPGEREIVKAIRQSIDARGKPVNSKTRILTLIVRYVFNTQHKRAFIYSRALGIAIKSNVTPDNFANWVAQSGGVEEIASMGATPQTIAKQEAIASKTQEVYTYLDDIHKNPLATIQPDAFISDTSVNYTLFLASTDATGTSKVLCSVPEVSQAVIDTCINKVAIAMMNKKMSFSVANTVPVINETELGSTPAIPEFTTYPNGIEVKAEGGLNAVTSRIHTDLAASQKQQ